MGRDFDVFLSHGTVQKAAVVELAQRLKSAGLEPWLDQWHLTPGVPWQNEVETALSRCASCAVLIGPDGLGKWQTGEMRAAIAERVRVGADRFRVIPVLLPGAGSAQRELLPLFLAAATWVEFGRTIDDDEAVRRLIAGIRGEAPGPSSSAPVLDGRCPYKGFRAFDVDDARVFYGREALTELLLSKLWLTLTSQNPLRLLAIAGASVTE